jgi:hypothetical protein
MTFAMIKVFNQKNRKRKVQVIDFIFPDISSSHQEIKHIRTTYDEEVNFYDTNDIFKHIESESHLAIIQTNDSMSVIGNEWLRSVQSEITPITSQFMYGITKFTMPGVFLPEKKFET